MSVLVKSAERLKQKDTMSNIGYDLDGVLYDYHRALYTELVIYDKLEQSFYEFWHHGYKTYKSEAWWENTIQLQHIYGTQPPKQGVVELLKDQAKRHTIYYVTNRPLAVELATRNWLRRYDFPYQENLIFCTDKRPVVLEKNISIFMEDRLHNAEQLNDICELYLVRTHANEDHLNNYKWINSVMDLKGVL